ncbi:response regulator [Phosphitispora fastidiosa]|uniref:response regulator n=1 Tax=Phosphitispora fastidiosa TaxID=2837202 RepID=UPI001E3CD478|nr:response regulator [Phosphitispora fastidiosa]MBU7005340.1 two-component system chemotaxis response regulator CheY [Phosphitispora fastidiosa]
MATVLVVDDAAFMRMRVAKLLKENGYNVEEAENGQVAVEKYAQIKPDMVLMDITMPVMDGLAALAEITRYDPGAKIVMCSALGQQNTVMAAIKAGAKDFIVKPYQPDKIISSIKRFVG